MFRHDASRDTSAHRRLQDGIYSYRLVLLNVKANATPAQAHTAIASVWKMLQDLRQGIVRASSRLMAGGYDAVPPKAAPPSFPGAEIPPGGTVALGGS